MAADARLILVNKNALAGLENVLGEGMLLPQFGMQGPASGMW